MSNFLHDVQLFTCKLLRVLYWQQRAGGQCCVVLCCGMLLLLLRRGLAIITAKTATLFLLIVTFYTIPYKALPYINIFLVRFHIKECMWLLWKVIFSHITAITATLFLLSLILHNSLQGSSIYEHFPCVVSYQGKNVWREGGKDWGRAQTTAL